MNAGVNVGNDKICVLLYADDVVVMSESAEELQSLLDVVDGYGRDFGVRFSSEKSKVMIVNKSEDERDMVWRIGENELRQTLEYRYLGMCMSPNGCEKAKNEKVSLVNQWVGRLGSAARMRASRYDVVREVWKSVAVPSVMYGMDVIAWNESEIDKLEVGQNRVARMALNAPRYAAIEALRGDMGWSTFRERLTKATLRYKIRLERMDETRIARKVYLWNESGSKWRKRCMRMTDKSGLQVVWGMRMAGRDQNEREWVVSSVMGFLRVYLLRE